jgi:hypothetical protein
MEKDYRTLKRASASRRSGEWNDDDFDVLANGVLSSAASSRYTPHCWNAVDVDAGIRTS